MSDGEIAKKVDEIFDMRPRAIEERLNCVTRITVKLLLTDTWDVNRR